MTIRWKRCGKYIAAAVLLFSAFLLILLLILGSGEQEELSGTFLCRLSQEESVLLFEEREGEAWLVYGGEENASLLKLNSLTGEVLARKEAAFSPAWASLGEGSLYLREDGDAGFRLVRYDAQTLEEVSCREVETDGGEPILFDCDSAGAVCFVTSKDRRTVNISPWEGDAVLRKYEERVSFLGLDGSDLLYVYAGGTLYAELDGGTVELPNIPAPEALLAPGMWIDEEGTLRRLDGEKAEALFRISELVYSSCFYCLDGENCLILSTGGGAVRKYESTGKPVKSCQVGGSVRGICPTGVLYEKDGCCYYARLTFGGAQGEAPASSQAPLSPSPGFSSSPSPNPSFSPSPAPSPGLAPEENAPAWVEKGFLVTNAGTTAARLRELLQPDTAEIKDVLGNQVLQGKLATGMTVNSWTVVVLGDCDGTGTVTGKDVREAMLLALSGQEDSPWCRAADLDNDGKIGAGDLIRISSMAAG